MMQLNSVISWKLLDVDSTELFNEVHKFYDYHKNMHNISNGELFDIVIFVCF